MVTLRIKGLEFSYESESVFSGVDLNIEEGDLISIVGRNGAGKSTLLKCINHILSPKKGDIYHNDNDIQSMKLLERAQRLGYLSQKQEQIFPSTVFDVVLTGRYPHSPIRFTNRDIDRVSEALSMMGLQEFAQREFNRLSGGEQQQVLIARAIVQGADILLFDEPTNNLDLKHQLGIMELIRRITHKSKKTAVTAIHDLNLASAFSDKIVVMHQGKIFSAGKPSEVLTSENIREVFGVDVKIYDHNGTPHIVMVGT